MQISNFCPKKGLWKWGNFGSQKVRSVINGAIFNRSASNLDCAHDFWVSPPGKLKNCILDIFGPLLGYWPFFGAPKVRGLITADPDVLYICNLAGTFCVMMSKMWLGKNLQFPSKEGPMEMGQLWVPESAVGPKLSNFQPFRLKFGLCTMISGYLHLKNRKDKFGANSCPFWGADPFWGTKITWYHNNYGTCSLFDLKFGRFWFRYDI